LVYFISPSSYSPARPKSPWDLNPSSPFPLTCKDPCGGEDHFWGGEGGQGTIMSPFQFDVPIHLWYCYNSW